MLDINPASSFPGSSSDVVGENVAGMDAAEAETAAAVGAVAGDELPVAGGNSEPDIAVAWVNVALETEVALVWADFDTSHHRVTCNLSLAVLSYYYYYYY